jgi:DNA helicase TIP49 (TBP-interacting protein)
MKRSCSSLLAGETVIFKIYNDIFKRKICETGDVLYVNKKNGTVAISWLRGYRSEADDIPFEDMVAVHNPNGEVMTCEVFTGKSDILTAD